MCLIEYVLLSSQRVIRGVTEQFKEERNKSTIFLREGFFEFNGYRRTLLMRIVV